jgi:hypothetical protein
MHESGIFLDYHGPVDLVAIELLLKKLKKTKEFADLNKTTGKRAYGLLVECLENIYKHSALKSSNDPGMQPHVSVRMKNDKIIILAGNPIPVDAKDNLVGRLNLINKSDEAALNTLYDNKINSDLKRDENCGGLGFISMAIKSGNKISYSFNPLTNDYLYFEIQISLNKYIMRKLIINQTNFSPKVILDPEKKVFQISGESRPPDVQEFYDQILTWLDDLSLHLIKMEDKKDPVIFNFDFEYFNSSSGKYILDICKVLARLRSKEININVNWHFEKDDDDMLLAGKEMSRIVKFPFEFIETGTK